VTGEERGEAEIQLAPLPQGGQDLRRDGGLQGRAATARRLPSLICSPGRCRLRECLLATGHRRSGCRELLEEAATALGADDSARRVEVLAALAVALAHLGEHGRSAVTRQQATDGASNRRSARALGGADALLLGACTTDMRDILTMLTEARIWRWTGDSRDAGGGVEWRISATSLWATSTRRGPTWSADGIGREIGQPFILHVSEHYHAALGSATGAWRMPRPRPSAQGVERADDRASPPPCTACSSSASVATGPAERAGPVVRVLPGGRRRSWRPAWPPCLRAGMHQEARRELDQYERRAGRLRLSLWLASLTYLTDACHAVATPSWPPSSTPSWRPLRWNVMIGHGVLV